MGNRNSNGCPPPSSCPHPLTLPSTAVHQPQRQYKPTCYPSSFQSIWPRVKQNETSKKLGGNARRQKAKKRGHKVSRKNNLLLVKAHAYNATRSELYPSTRTPNPSAHVPPQLATLPAKSFHRLRIENGNENDRKKTKPPFLPLPLKSGRGHLHDLLSRTQSARTQRSVAVGRRSTQLNTGERKELGLRNTSTRRAT